MAVDRRCLPKALKILTDARNEILRVLAEGDRRDQVYQLDISLLPLTRNNLAREEPKTHE